jgi:hypothetical protein
MGSMTMRLVVPHWQPGLATYYEKAGVRTNLNLV